MRPSLNIFYVEDNPADADLLKEALRTQGSPFSVTVLKDGQQALDLVRLNSAVPDLIILDLNLEAVDGLTVLSAFKADVRWRHVPVLVFVEPRAPNARRAKDLGADLCCAKPMDWSGWPGLIDAITELSARDDNQAATQKLRAAQ